MSNGTARTQLVIKLGVEYPLPVPARLIIAFKLRSKTLVTKSVATIICHRFRCGKVPAVLHCMGCHVCPSSALANGCALVPQFRRQQKIFAQDGLSHVISPVRARICVGDTCWSLMLCHWSGEGVHESAVSGHFRYFAHRRAPLLPLRLLQLLIDRFGDDHTAAADEYRRIWFVLCSLCQVHLWVERKAVIFRGKTTSPAHSALAFWRSGLRQLKAIAMQEHRSAATAVRGAWTFSAKFLQVARLH